jgi:SAM-dependent methyltransferase
MLDGYVTTTPLSARIAIHAYGSNPVPWFDFVRARLGPGDAVLEVGAGTGALWSGAQRPARLVLTDASPTMCATQRAAGFVTALARGERLPFADGSFDGAVANHVLYHLPDPRAGLAELRRVVRAGGWVAVATNGAGHMREVSDLAVAAGLPRADVHERFPAEAAPAAVGEWFGEVEVHAYDDVLAVPEVEPVVAYVASLVQRPLTPAEERAVRDGVPTLPFAIHKHTVLVTARAGR